MLESLPVQNYHQLKRQENGRIGEGAGSFLRDVCRREEQTVDLANALKRSS